MKMNVKGKIRRGTPKNIWLDMIKNDIKAIGMCVGDIKNRDKWSFRTKVADPK